MKRCRIASLADIEAIESQPYAEFMAHDSVFDALSDSAGQHADRTALSFVQAADAPDTTQRWTYRAFIADVRRAANLLRALAGDEEPRVAILLPAIPQAYFTLWGAETAGVACPINYLLASEHVAELITAAGANILVALGPNTDLDIWSRAGGLRAQCPSLRHVLAVGGVGQGEGASDFDAALAAQRGDALSFERPVQAGTLAALFHTGGPV